MNQTQEIPSANDVNIPRQGRYAYYRIGTGTIETGSKNKGTLQEIPKLVGRIVRVGLHESTGEWQSKALEVELETRDYGPVNLSVELLDPKKNFKPSLKAVCFADALTKCAAGDIVAIEANLSRKANEFGNYSTYVNFHRLEGGDWKRIDRDRAPQGQSIPDQFAALLVKLQALPHWGARTQEIDADTHLGHLAAKVKELDWMSIEGNEGKWLRFINEALLGGTKYANLHDIPDDVIGEIRQKWEAKGWKEHPKQGEYLDEFAAEGGW